MKISSFKIPIRPLGTQEDTVITIEQTVKGSDIEFGGFSRNIYRKAVKEIKEGDYPMPIHIPMSIHIPMPMTVDDDDSRFIMGDKEYERLTTKCFPKWSKENTKISSFMQSLDPFKLYTEKEIKEVCKDSGVKLIQVMKNEFVSGSNGYGIILYNFNKTYTLYKCLIKSFEKYF